jgi:hypothetical protein
MVIENDDDVVMYYGAANSAVVLDLATGSTYWFKVKATSAVGDGDWSALSTFLIVDAPSPPFNVQLAAFDNTLVTLTWSQPLSNGGQALTGFKVYRRDCSEVDNEASELFTAPAGQFLYTDTTITGGDCYAYFVTSQN